MKHKNEVTEKFKEYIRQVDAKFNTKIERLRCDNGGEYVSQEFKNLCKNHGIRIQYSVPRNPEQNGAAERLNRTIMEKARCLIFDGNLSKEFWGEAVRVAVYLMNRTETSALKDRKLPASMWYGYEPNLDKIKLFGCVVYNLIPKEDRSSKLDVRSKKMLMMGYTDNGYRLWDPTERKIIHARNVIFNEQEDKENIVILEDELEQNDNLRENELPKQTPKYVREEDRSLRRSERERRLPQYLQDYELLDEENLMTALSAACLPSELPQSYEDAVKDEGWKKAIEEELDSLRENETWEITEAPEDEEIIDSKWVFKEKKSMVK